MQRFIVLMIMITGFSCIFWTCKDGPTKPKDDTQDTTSHNFSWTITRLGDGAGSSSLYDVAIINDTLAYAVGQIYFGGSICDLVKWNGHQWDTMHVPVTLTYSSSQIVTDQDPLKAICAFDKNDIWVVSQAGGVSHWNGTQWIMLIIPFNQGPGSYCNKIWGTSSTNLYFVGNNGRIIYYNRVNWTKIESGTTLSLNDIYGAYNSSTSQWEILAVGSSNLPLDKIILSIQGTTASILSSIPIQYELYSVWFVPNQHYYVIGDGIYEKNSLSDSGWKNSPNGTTNYATTSMRGNGLNDIFAAGAYGEVLHYNGNNWHSYQAIIGLSDGSYGSVAMKNNTVIIVGYNSSQAVITIGRR